MNHEPDFFDLQAVLCNFLNRVIRLWIISILKTFPQLLKHISVETGMLQPTVARHLAVLPSNVFVAARLRAQEVYCASTNPVVEVREMMCRILAGRETQQPDRLHPIQG